MMCDVDIRKELYAIVVLSVARPFFERFVERMTKEPTACAPSTMHFHVVAPPEKFLVFS